MGAAAAVAVDVVQADNKTARGKIQFQVDQVRQQFRLWKQCTHANLHHTLSISMSEISIFFHPDVVISMRDPLFRTANRRSRGDSSPCICARTHTQRR